MAKTKTDDEAGTGINTLVDQWSFHSDPNPGRLFFICPHCETEVVQHASNFHYWCPGCGLNARDE